MRSACRGFIGRCWTLFRGNNHADGSSRGTLMAKATLKGYIQVPEK